MSVSEEPDNLLSATDFSEYTHVQSVVEDPEDGRIERMESFRKVRAEAVAPRELEVNA
jgi:hypothetical protein